MGREEAVDPFKDLKQHSLPNHQIERINISEALMTRITASQSGSRIQSYKPVRKLSIYTAVIFIVLLASASVYAASVLYKFIIVPGM